MNRIRKYVDKLHFYRNSNVIKNILAVKIHNPERDSMFRYIHIETINRCNGSCSFCPVNSNEEQRPYAKMSDELFLKIISDLKKINYQGFIGLFCNNEPFLDPRINQFAKITKEYLPNCKIEINTNGSLLTVDKFKDIIPYCDYLVIDNYNDRGRLNERPKMIRDYLREEPKYAEKVRIWMRKQNEVLSSRGGQAPNKKNAEMLPISCYLPFSQMVIRPDGKVSLCCNDALGKYTLGDVTKGFLWEVWNSPARKRIMKELKVNGRKNLECCKNCDFLGGIGVEKNNGLFSEKNIKNGIIIRE